VPISQEHLDWLDFSKIDALEKERKNLLREKKKIKKELKAAKGASETDKDYLREQIKERKERMGVLIRQISQCLKDKKDKLKIAKEQMRLKIQQSKKAT